MNKNKEFYSKLLLILDFVFIIATLALAVAIPLNVLHSTDIELTKKLGACFLGCMVYDLARIR